jgi:hypothetical protein
MGNIQHTSLAQCLNCGNELKATDRFCSLCGQRTQGTRVPIKNFIAEFFQDYFTVDSKFFRSILLLIIKPGTLTKRFNDGKRKSFIAPLRMYLFTSFIYFFLLSLNLKENSDFIDLNIEDSSRNQEDKVALLDSLLAIEGDTVNLAEFRERFPPTEAEEQEPFISLSDNENDFFGMEEGIQKANKNPELLLQTLFKVASVALFFLVPLFALILWVFHHRKSAYYAPNLVHALHLHTFAFALFSIWLGVKTFAPESAFLSIMAVLAGYAVWSIKVVYSQKFFPALVKSFFITLIYFFILILALIPTLFATLMTV